MRDEKNYPAANNHAERAPTPQLVEPRKDGRNERYNKTILKLSNVINGEIMFKGKMHKVDNYDHKKYHFAGLDAWDLQLDSGKLFNVQIYKEYVDCNNVCCLAVNKELSCSTEEKWKCNAKFMYTINVQHDPTGTSQVTVAYHMQGRHCYEYVPITLPLIMS